MLKNSVKEGTSVKWVHPKKNSKKASESLIELTESISLPKPVVKSGGDNCFLNAKTIIQDFMKHEYSRKHDTIK